ncbi:MobA/MobL family protein [Bordetella petrii]|uniref:MobA/MobL family protein n=1 Tax=Bordetella petrii TaxID=94624 RepID=UPI001A9576CA|nr:MobA/MobL family protein [Bordetella petrii]MBO1111830.1 MobA/MobL family protein [Bordetella petrii]
MASFHFSIKRGKKGTAKEHARYITRQGSHAQRGDLVATSHGNLPKWAAGDPAKFWAASDTHERNNGSAYRELEIALPGELKSSEQTALVNNVVKQMVGSKPFQFAIHGPNAAIDGAIKNTHVHIMLSDRSDDGIERSEEKTFKRYNPKHPERGGRRKDSGGRNKLALRDELIETRRLCAELQNAALAAAGHDARVDHRSLKDQGVEREPERHLGPARVRGMKKEEKEQLVEARQTAPKSTEER